MDTEVATSVYVLLQYFCIKLGSFIVYSQYFLLYFVVCSICNIYLSDRISNLGLHRKEKYKVFMPCGGTEKEYRRDLYEKKKRKKVWDQKLSPILPSKPIRIPKKATMLDIEDIYSKLPKYTEFKPKAGIEIGWKFKLLKWFCGNSDQVSIDKILAFSESISLLLYNYRLATSRKHKLMILLMWAQNRFFSEKSILLNLTDVILWSTGFEIADVKNIVGSIGDLWQGVSPLTSSIDLEPRAGFERAPVHPDNFVPESSMDDGTMKNIANSESVRRLKAMLQMFIDAGMCSIFGFDFDLGKAHVGLDWVNKTLHRVELIEFSMNTIMYFVQRGYAAYSKRDIKYFFYAENFIDFEIEFRTVETEIQAMFSGFITSTLDISQLDIRVTKLINKLQKQIPMVKGPYKLTLSDRLKKCFQLRQDLVGLQKKIGVRRAPYTMLIWGQSGIGKSFVTQTLAPSLLGSIGLPTDPYLIRTPNQNEEFDSMLDSNTLAVVLDDICNAKPSKTTKNPLDALLRLANNITVAANKPALEEKGKVFLTPYLLIATSNLKEVDAVTYSNEPISILRRFDVIAKVNCENRYMTGGQLDIEKWPEENRKYGKPPCTFTIERVVGAPVPEQEGGAHVAQKYKFEVVKWYDPIEDKELLMKDVPWETFERYSKERCIEKTKKQTDYLTLLKVTSNPHSCKHNVTFPLCSKCAPHKEVLCRFVAKYIVPKLGLRAVLTMKPGSRKATPVEKKRGHRTWAIESVSWVPKKSGISEHFRTAFDAVLSSTGILQNSILNVPYQPSAGDEEYNGREEWKMSSETGMTEKAYKCQVEAYNKLLDWWAYIKEKDLHEIDMDYYDRIAMDRVTLDTSRIGEVVPTSILNWPEVIPPAEHLLLRYRRIENSQVQEIVEKTVDGRALLRRAQSQFQLEALRSDPGEPDTQTQAQWEWANRWCSIKDRAESTLARFPFKLGMWLGNKHEDCEEFAYFTSIFGHTVGVMTATLMSSVMIVNPIIGFAMSVIIPALGFINCTFMLLGIRFRKHINTVTKLAQSIDFVVSTARSALHRKNRIIFGALMVMSVGLAYYNYKKVKPSFEPSGNAFAVPEPRVNERTNNYWTASPENYPEKFGVSGFQTTPSELYNIMKTQTVRVQVFPPGIRNLTDAEGSNCIGCCGVTMAGGLLVVPKHIVASRIGQLINVRRDSNGVICNSANWILDEDDIYYPPGTDFAFLFTRHLGAAKDLRRYLPTRIVKDNVNVLWHLLDSDGSKYLWKKGSAFTRFDNHTPVSSVGVYDGYTFAIHDEKQERYESKSGYCMSMFLSCTNPSIIHSFYLAGSDKLHRSAPLLVSYVDAALDFFKKNKGRALLPSAGEFKAHTELKRTCAKRSPLNFLDKSEEKNLSFDWLGSVETSRRFYGTVKPTPMAEHIEPIFGVDHKWASPKNIGNWRPWWDNLIAMSAKVNAFESSTLKVAFEDLKGSLIQKCKNYEGFSGEKFIDLVHPVSKEVAINGVPGVAGCDRVKMNTSAGYPHNCSKKVVLEEVPDTKYPCGVRLEPNKAVDEEIDRIIDCASRDERSNVVFRASLKDEPTNVTKEEVRVFAGCSVSYLVAVRMYTSMLVKFMTDNHLLFNTVAGANCHDYDWTLIGNYMAEYSTKNVIAGDYKKFDKKVLAELMCLACELTLCMLELAGYSEENLRIAKNLIFESCFPIYEWNGDFISMCGSNPSGQPLTVWINNLVNLLYQRYVFYTFYPSSVKFDDCVRILVLGDDNIMSVKDGYEKYNHTAIQDVLAKLGMAYTMADKSAGSVPYIPLEQASLLKRSIIWNEDYQTYMCPIEEKSIYRCLSCHMLKCGKESETLKLHCKMMVQTALTEWFYHGKEIYEDRFEKCMTMLQKAGLGMFTRDQFSTFEEQEIAFKRRVMESQCLKSIEIKFPWSVSMEADTQQVFIETFEVIEDYCETL